MKNNIKLITKLSTKCLFLELDNRKLKLKNKKIEKELKEINDNNLFLLNEISLLKQINKKRYLEYEEKMKFLIKRENKLQEIEQMVSNNVDFRKVRKRIKEV